jgi:hypothetical protein
VRRRKRARRVLFTLVVLQAMGYALLLTVGRPEERWKELLLFSPTVVFLGLLTFDLGVAGIRWLLALDIPKETGV